METAKAAEDGAQAEERDRKVQKVRKGARQIYEQTVFEGRNVFFTPSRKFEGAFPHLAADAKEEGAGMGPNTSMPKRYVQPDGS